MFSHLRSSGNKHGGRKRGKKGQWKGAMKRGKKGTKEMNQVMCVFLGCHVNGCLQNVQMVYNSWGRYLHACGSKNNHGNWKLHGGVKIIMEIESCLVIRYRSFGQKLFLKSNSILHLFWSTGAVNSKTRPIFRRMNNFIVPNFSFQTSEKKDL